MPRWAILMYTVMTVLSWYLATVVGDVTVRWLLNLPPLK